ncbi:unnamed protein product, partial [Darwinula stevensoni]
MEGLLVSGMTETAKGMLENFFHLVDELGFVPNGGRVYYKKRSQPPFLCLMAKKYYDHTGDFDFIKRNLDLLDREFKFWEENRLVEVKKDTNTHYVYRYIVNVTGPRPESYKEDVATVGGLSKTDQDNLHVSIKSACESGMDFSTRWMRDPEKGDLKTLMTQSIVPVDLNALMCRNALILEEFYLGVSNSTAAGWYQTRSQSLKKAIQDLFWDETDMTWYDFDLDSK